MTEPVKSLALRLLDGYENHVSAAVLWRKKIGYWNRDVQGITGLHCIAFLGIVEIASTMRERKGRQVNVEILCIFPMYIQHTTVYSFT